MRKTEEEFMNDLKRNHSLSDEEMSQASGGEGSTGNPTCNPRFNVGDLVLLVDDDGSQYDKIEIKQAVWRYTEWYYICRMSMPELGWVAENARLAEHDLKPR